MEEQVLSAEQMQELIDMGIDVSKASMVWEYWCAENKYILTTKKLCSIDIENVPDNIPTFTIHDILDMLPNTIEWKGKTYWFSVFVNSLGNKMIGYRDSELWALEFKYFNVNGAFAILKWCKQNSKL